MTRIIALLAALATAAPALAQEPVNLRPDMPSVTVETEGGPAEIARIQDNAHELSGEWART